MAVEREERKDLELISACFGIGNEMWISVLRAFQLSSE
jgi:hypothetical protein